LDISDIPVDSPDLHSAFLASERKHVLMITNHGIHQWRIVPGLPDTGGQNVFVNEFSGALERLGFRITIANRGGYPHPVTGDRRTGLVYRDRHQRILYLQDGRPEFVRKEDMHEQIPSLVDFLGHFLNSEGPKPDLLISHYWDAAEIGARYKEQWGDPALHIWVPHSLGVLKKRNVPSDHWRDLRIDERIAVERDLVHQVDGIAATSDTIEQVLVEDYRYDGPQLFLPPCVNTERYHPRQVAADDRVWSFLSRRSGLSLEEVRRSKVVTEISRTDTTKRKNVLIRAFAQVQEKLLDTLLIVSIDDNQPDLAAELRSLIQDLGVEDRVAVVGSVWDLLPVLYAATDVYCTPSVMEGFGMSAQEAAATAVPVVSSHLIPFVSGYLMGPEAEQVSFAEGHEPLQVGEGAIVVQADDVEGFAKALEMLLTDEPLREEMGQNAFRATVPRFTWQRVAARFLDQIEVFPEG
jgi:mannosylfructose-phosphate synthase